MARKKSMDDIARELGISKNTVSLVFRGFPGVNEATKAKVLETASRLGYRYPKDRFSDEDIKPVKSILIVIPHSARNSPDFFSHVQFGIESEASRNGLNTVISYYDDQEGLMGLPLCIRESLVSGIITIGRIEKEVYTLLKSSKLPIVMADHYYEDMPVDSVLSDNFCGGYMAAKHLLSNGHKEIGFIGDTSISLSFYERFQGYVKALESEGIKVRDENLVRKSYKALIAGDLPSIVENMAAVQALPSAFFCCNDIVAITLVKSLNPIGIKVPDDISVIGFDDIGLASNFYPELTTVRVEKELMGAKAVQMLVELLEAGIGIPQKTALSVSLVERQSVRKL